MQRSRRTNPYPVTWEIPLAAAAAAVLLLVLGVHAGRAGANLIAGAGPTLPAREALFTSLGGVLNGHADAGLTGVSGRVAGPVAVQVWVAVTEALVLALIVRAGKMSLDRWGPRRVHGMATRNEAEQLLGRSRLRRAAALVRPDLYAKRR
ncbi:MAG TPA: hypothetical protein VFJ97_13900 [Dermatophilaceae bacterium]|nr:hypothetical protein [Dermatophilaceae bacterium]